MSSVQIERENYVKAFSERLAAFVNHPLNSYKPTNFKWKGQGGQSKVLGFYSQARKKDLVVKIYPAVYYADAKNEFNNMNLLVHDNILQVYEMHTIYVGDPKKIPKDADSSGSLNLDSGSEESKNDIEEALDEGAQHADIIIIMEKADKTLSKVISQRSVAKNPFSSIELLDFWRKIINVFAFCTVFQISHNDIKPSNILLVKVQNSKTDGDLNQTWVPKIADFGTSIQKAESQDTKVRLLNTDSMFTNMMTAMTPLYASPNVVQDAPKINNYLEDVFSLGMTFLQMAGLFKDNQLNSYSLNREAAQYHLVSRYIELSESEYVKLDSQRAQEVRLTKAIEVCKNLPYFHTQILKFMLRWEATERPSSIKLKKIFSDDNLFENLENKDYVDNLIQSVMKTDDNQMMEEIKNNQELSNSDEDSSDSSIQFTIKKEGEQQDIVNDLEFQIDQYRAHKEKQASMVKKRTLNMGSDSNQITVRVRELQNGVTKLISGRPEFDVADFTLAAKAIYQSDALILIDYKDMIRYDSLQKDTLKKCLIKNAKKFLPFKYDRKGKHPERTFLFLSESITAVTPNGKIYVIGGQFLQSYQKYTYMLVPQLKLQKDNQFRETQSPFEEYAHLADTDDIDFYETYRVKDMLNAKTNFGHFTTNYEIFIAGGTTQNQFCLSQVENYDIKKDVWMKKPDLNEPRRSPSICLFRNRFLYVFGGTQLKDKSEIEQLNQEQQMTKLNSKQRKAESDEGSLKLDSLEEEDKEQEEDEDALSAEVISEDSFFDEEEVENNYEIDFGEYYVTTIERLDMQANSSQRLKWELIKLRSDIRLEGQQFGSIQCSVDEIILFGSNFKSEWPTFSTVQVYKFNHELKTVSKEKEIMNNINGVKPEDENYGMFTLGYYQDTVTTFENTAIAMPQNMSQNPENTQILCIQIGS